MIRLYHNPNCSKSRQALKLLHDHGATVRVVEYLKNPLTVEALQDLLHKLSMTPHQLLRRGEKLATVEGKQPATQEEILKLMARHPIVIERPIAVLGNRAVVARPPEKVLELLQR